MPYWLIDIYVLVTSRVPRPNSLLLYGGMSLGSLALMRPYEETLIAVGLFPALLAVLAGHLSVVCLNLPNTIRRLETLERGPRVILTTVLPIYAACLFAPSLALIQHAISLLILIYIALFVMFFNDMKLRNDIPWFAQGWNEGQRNAANWNVARLVATLLCNETLARYGSPTDWVVGIALAPIALHYLMHWTILATHPYEGEDIQD